MSCWIRLRNEAWAPGLRLQRLRRSGAAEALERVTVKAELPVKKRRGRKPAAAQAGTEECPLPSTPPVEECPMPTPKPA